MENIVKIYGLKTNCNNNLNKKNLKYLVSLLHDKFYCERRIQPELLELIAGFTFSITGDFDAVLDDDADVLDDVKKTQENLDKLEDFL